MACPVMEGGGGGGGERSTEGIILSLSDPSPSLKQRTSRKERNWGKRMTREREKRRANEKNGRREIWIEKGKRR